MECKNEPVMESSMVSCMEARKDEVEKDEVEKDEVGKEAVVEKEAGKVSKGEEDASKGEEDGNETAVNCNEERRHWDNTSKKVIVRNVLKFVRPKEVSKMVASWIGNDNGDGNGNGNGRIIVQKVKKPPRDNWVKVTLESEDMVEPFIKLINEGRDGKGAMLNRRGGKLFAKRVDDRDDRDDRDGDRRHSTTRDDNSRHGKRKRTARDDKHGDKDGADGDKNGADGKRRNSMRILSTDEVRDAITPLWRMPYQDQLDLKWKEMVKKCAMKICSEIKTKHRLLEKEAKRNPQHRSKVKLYDWVAAKRAIEVDRPIPSPKIYEYRNKCEFTCGYHHQIVQTNQKEDSNDNDNDNDNDNGNDNNNDNDNIQKTPAAGFLAQGWQGGVYPPHALPNMPDWACGLSDLFSQFLSSSSIPPYDSKVHRGIWRSFTLRCSLRTKECMVVVLHAPPKGGVGAKSDGSDDYSHVFEKEKMRLIDLLTHGEIPEPEREFPEGEEEKEGHVRDNHDESGGIRVTSVFFQEYEGLSHPPPEHPVQHAYGKTSLQEKLGQCTFQISPGAFFQVNTEGAETLYDIVVQRLREFTMSRDPKQTLLLDVCCGTGTIGLTCLKEGVVGRLLGVDISLPAIVDAKVNAEMNGWTTNRDANKDDKNDNDKDDKNENNQDDNKDKDDDDKDDKNDDNVTNAGNNNNDNPTRFLASRAETILSQELNHIPLSTPMVAVVDPAREGLHPTVIRTLRLAHKIHRLIYVSCNPTGTLVRDAAMLCSPPTKKYGGTPFRVVRCQPVDMFPLTNHCEMVMTLDRLEE